MLELLISLRRARGEGAVGGAVKTDKKVGDVICAKVSPAVWGTMEHKYFMIVKYEDAALEKTVIKNEGVLSLPFARYDAEGTTVTRSDKRLNVIAFIARQSVDVAKLPNQVKQVIKKVLQSELS